MACADGLQTDAMQVMTPQGQRLAVPALHRDGDGPPSARDEGWLFVFGSNLAGRHGAGAALVAAERYGAQSGVGEGAFASSYAIPTKGHSLEVLPLTVIAEHVERFVLWANAHPDRQYWLTRVGCGLAGYSNDQIVPLFTGLRVQRLSITAQWMPYWVAALNRAGQL